MVPSWPSCRGAHRGTSADQLAPDLPLCARPERFASGNLARHDGSERLQDETLVEVAADTLGDGRVVYEALWVQAVPSGGYRVMKTPLVAQGLAANDEIEVDPGDKSFRVLNRGGNVTIQLSCSPS